VAPLLQGSNHVPPPGPQSPPVTPAWANLTPGRRPSRAVLAAVIAWIVVVAAVILGLALVPVTHGFSFQIQACPQGIVTHSYPDNANVVVHWAEPDGSAVEFIIETSAGGTLYDQTLNSASYTFTSDGGGYVFTIGGGCGFFGNAAPVGVWGHWSAPLL
jgi:hypothetical protein